MKILLTILILATACGTALAGIQWTWANAGTGTEQGTIITDGTLVAEEAPAGTYTIPDYSISASAYGLPDMVGLGIEWFAVVEDDDVDHYCENLTPIITPEGNITPNERATFGAVKVLYR